MAKVIELGSYWVCKKPMKRSYPYKTYRVAYVKKWLFFKKKVFIPQDEAIIIDVKKNERVEVTYKEENTIFFEEESKQKDPLIYTGFCKPQLFNQHFRREVKGA